MIRIASIVTGRSFRDKNINANKDIIDLIIIFNKMEKRIIELEKKIIELKKNQVNERHCPSAV
jgi:hypothetical protein